MSEITYTRGDTRDDGYRFLNYYKDPSSKTGLREKWAHPERFKRENEYQAWYRANRRKY